jgi:hypothetical protein
VGMGAHMGICEGSTRDYGSELPYCSRHGRETGRVEGRPYLGQGWDA